MRTERDVGVKQKAFFIIFKGLSVAKSCLRTESAPLMPVNLDVSYPHKQKWTCFMKNSWALSVMNLFFNEFLNKDSSVSVYIRSIQWPAAQLKCSNSIMDYHHP